MATYDYFVGDVGRTKTFTPTRAGARITTSAAGPIEFYAVKPSGRRATVGGSYVVTADASLEFTWEPTAATDIDEAGTWTLQAHVIDGTDDFLCDPVALLVGAKLGTDTAASITITGGTAAQVQAALEALDAIATATEPGVLTLRGALTFTAPVVMTGLSNLRIVLDPDCVITGAFTSGSADSATNALFYLTPDMSPTTSTTLTADVAAGETALTVTSETGFADGDWVLVHGVYGSAPLTDGNYWEEQFELLRCSGTAANTVNLRSHVLGFHSATDDVTYDPATVEEILPCTNIAFEGKGILDGGTGGTATACGISARSVAGLRIEGLREQNFSRAGFHLDQGTRDVIIKDVRRLGGSNATIHVEACCHVGTITGCSYAPDGDYEHASGIPRAYLVMRGRNVAWKIDGAFGRANIGVQFWGGEHLQVEGIIDDCDPTARVARAGAEGVGGVITRLGVGFDGGCTSTTAWTAFGLDWKLKLQIVDVVCPTSLMWAAYVHDCYHVDADLQIINRGISGTAAGARDMNGLTISDILGINRINVMLRGMTGSGAIRFENVGAQGLHINAQIYPSSGTTPAPTTSAVFFDTDQGSSAITFDSLDVGGYTNVFQFGDNFGSNYSITGRSLWLDGFWQPSGYWTVAANGIGTNLANGRVVLLDPTSTASTRRIAAPAGGAERGLVAVAAGSGDTNSAYCVVQLPRAGTMNVLCSGAVAPGDLIRHDAGGTAVADNTTPADFTCLGVALVAKALAGTAVLPVA